MIYKIYLIFDSIVKVNQTIGNEIKFIHELNQT